MLGGRNEGVGEREEEEPLVEKLKWVFFLYFKRARHFPFEMIFFPLNENAA